MQTNLWNLKSSNERLSIRERTQAHKRHLISLIKTKSQISDKNKEWRVKSLNADYNKRKQWSIDRENQGLIQRLGKSHNSKSKPNSSSSQRLLNVTQNLRAISSISRQNKIRVIQEENDKIFNRLVNASSTFSKRSWLHNIRQNSKFKLNISRTKYSNPDYSTEVSKVVKTRKMTFKHLKLSRTEDSLPEITLSHGSSLRV